MNLISTSTPSRLEEKQIKSRRLGIKGKKPRAREPIIAFSVNDLNAFFELTRINGRLVRQAQVLKSSNSYIHLERKREGNGELNDILGMTLLGYFNEILNLFPENLPEQIVLELCKRRGYIHGNATSIGKNLKGKEVVQSLYATLLKNIENRRVSDVFYKHQLRELWLLTDMHSKEFVKVYSYGEIPEGVEHTSICSLEHSIYQAVDPKEYFTPNQQWEKDKTIRLWLAWGIALGLISKRELLDKLDDLSVNQENMTKFQPLREKFSEL